MSSTILYLAIVAIWAGVLVPRWLRREPHRESQSKQAAAQMTSGQVADVEVVDQAGVELASSDGSGLTARLHGSAENGRRPDDAARRPDDDVQRPDDDVQRPDDDVQRPDDGARRPTRVVTARRRLLALLLVLFASAAVAAVSGLAAWWVIVPPTSMVAGYLLLLREAARADAERRQARVAAARDAAAQAGRARPGTAEAAGGIAADQAGAGLTTATAKVLDITERAERAGEEPYDQYTDAKLRAVGD